MCSSGPDPMFKWLKNRYEFEVKKLIFQNMSAANVLEGLILVSTKDPETIEVIEGYANVNRHIATSFAQTGTISSEDHNKLVHINRAFRHLHDILANSSLKFDEVHVPPQGWKRYCAKWPDC